MYSFECPVKPGQTVYHVKRYILGKDNINFVDEIRVDFVAFDHYGWSGRTVGNCEVANEEAWMVTVFPTREEAEAILKKLNEERK